MLVNHVTNVPAVPHDDDFELCPLVHEQIIHGDIFSCIDGNWNDGERQESDLHEMLPSVALKTS